MKRILAFGALLGTLAIAGYALAGAVSTGSVAVCVGAKVPAQTIAANGKPIAVIPGKRAVDCRTVTYTVPTETSTTLETRTETTTETQTQTETLPGTTTVLTTTLPVTTTVTQPVTTTLPAQTVTTTQTVTQPPVTTTVTQTITVPGGSGAPGPFVASVWLGPNGSDSGPGCAFRTTAVGNPGASSCATPQQACAIADANGNGHTIGVEGGFYPSVGFNLNGCHDVTFQTDTGAFAAFEPNSTFTNTTNVTLRGDAKGHGVGFSLAYSSVPAGNTGLVWNDVNLYCQVGGGPTGWIQIHSNQTGEDACNDAININANGFQWIFGDQSAWGVCETSCTHTGPQGNPNDDFINPAARNVLIQGVTQRNYFALDSSGIHSELWFLNGGDGITFDSDQMVDCAPPASTGYAVNTSCNTSVVFVGQLAGTIPTTNHLTISNTIIAGGHPLQKSFQSGYDVPAGTEPTFTFVNDSMDSSLTVCGPTDAKYSNTPATAFWKAPGAFDFTPLPPIQSNGDPSYCPPFDVNGNPRSAGVCDRGAI